MTGTTARPQAPLVTATGGPWRLGLAGLATLAVCYGFGRYGYGLFLPRFQAEFGGSVGALGAITSAGYVGELLALAAVARMAGRTSPRWPIGIGVVCAGVGMLIIGLAQTKMMLVAGVAISGMSPGWVWAPYSDVVQDTVRPDGRRHALSMISTGTTFGVILAGPAALLASGAWWRVVWIAAAVVALIVAFWNVRVLPSAPRTPVPRKQHEPGGSLITRPGAARLFIAAASSGLVGAGYWSFAGAAVSAANDADQRVAPVLWTLIGVAGIVGVRTGSLVRRGGLRSVFVTAQVMLTCSTAVLWLAPHGWAFVLMSATLFGAGYMIGGTLLSVWSSTVFTDHPTRGFSLVIVFITIGAAAGPALLGLVVDHAGTPAAFAVITLIAAATLAALPHHDRHQEAHR